MTSWGGLKAKGKRACWRGLRTNSRGLRACWRGLMTSQKGLNLLVAPLEYKVL